MYIHVPTGFIFALPRSGAIEVAGQQVGPHTSEAALLALDCEVYVEPPPVPVEPPGLQISKLRLRRGLRAAGLEAAFDAALAGNAEWAADWADATELSSDDPILLAALPALAAAAGLTVEQAQALLKSAAL